MASGAKASECNLAQLFGLATEDPFLILAEMRQLREHRYNARAAKLSAERSI